ncbi:TonB-linked SusC/RagA family outer membrane protein [Pedobacter sp. UYP30]|uniref:SusC/RagA family TonB-linked outer membrane protein n=1 Tax=Pedobacter sp. UYP30 TaxID=1756400 RepID=UPI00339B35A9
MRRRLLHFNGSVFGREPKVFHPSWISKCAFMLLCFCLLSLGAMAQNKVTGKVTDSKGETLVGVTIAVKGTKTGTSTDANGNYSIEAPSNATLLFAYVGYVAQNIPLNGRTTINVQLKDDQQALDEVVVTGYGTQKKESITGAISGVTSKDIDRVHAGANVSTALAGKIPGVTFRQSDGRPGSSASIQIRNMGDPLYVIDGIQQDAGQFNNLNPNDIESINVLKDASAAIYGVRAANGVVVVTTKKGTGETRINIDGYLGFQSFTRFPHVTSNSYDYARYLAEAQVNQGNTPSYSPDDLTKFQAGTDPAYRSFDWRSYVLSNDGAPQNFVNVNFTGGSEKVKYYISAANVYQNSQLGKEFFFNRSNIQSNVQAQVANGLKVSLDLNGRVESVENPGVPGGDDYFLARFAVLRNLPTERPYANDNPLYLNKISNTESNYAFLNDKLAGKFRSDWRVLQTNFNAEYDVPWVKGLTAKGTYSYYVADRLLNNQEYTYKAYTYRPATDTYDVTGGSTNPWREREQRKEFATTSQFQLTYKNTFGLHSINATAVAERLTNRHLRNWVHANPISNSLPLIYYPIIDQYQDSDTKEARVGYVGKIDYSYAGKYYVSGYFRRDANYLFRPDSRVGFFPGFSAGWRITEEKFMKNLLGENSVLNDLKFRGSYGLLGDDRNTVEPYAYLPGYNYNQGTAIIDGNSVIVSRDKGLPITRISWTKSLITDFGVDFSMFNTKLTGSADYFYRKRTGLIGPKNDITLPVELGYNLPNENINSDSNEGVEGSLSYQTKIGEVGLNIGGNVSYSRAKFISSYNPLFFNSLDQYRNSSENRYRDITWGMVATGQFESQDQINNYPVNIDGKGNRTLLPGDIIYKDQNGDGIINGLDERPIGYGYGTQPNINFGFNFAVNYKSFDFHADFSGASGYTWFQNYETRWPFQNNGNFNTIFADRWHRADPYDISSAWIPGKYPALRVNPGFGLSDYSVGGQQNSTFWLHNVSYLRARTIELGYSLPDKWVKYVKMKKARFYINAYNLFSFDNLKQYSIDPEVSDDNGLQFPQNRIINVGTNITF